MATYKELPKVDKATAVATTDNALVEQDGTVRRVPVSLILSDALTTTEIDTACPL